MRRRSVSKGSVKREFWFKHIENWQISGLKQKEYCAIENISLCSFTSWRTQFLSANNDKGQKQTAVKFIPAKIKSIFADSITVNTTGISVLLPNQIKLMLPPGMPQNELFEILLTLGKLS